MREPAINRSEINDLEHILASEEELQPMTGFSTRVMRAVREEAAAPAPIAFPWARFLPGFLLNLGLLLVAAVWTVVELGSSPVAQPVPAEWLSDPQVQGLLWAALTVVGTCVLAWTALRLATPRRTMSF